MPSDFLDLQGRVIDQLKTLTDCWPTRNVTEWDYTFIGNGQEAGAVVYVGGARLRKTQIGQQRWSGDRDICIDVCVHMAEGWYRELLRLSDRVEEALMDNCVLLSNSSVSREMEWFQPEPLYGPRGSGPHWMKRTAIIVRRGENA